MPGEAQLRHSLHCVNEGGEKKILLWCSFTCLLRELFHGPAGAMAFSGSFQPFQVLVLSDAAELGADQTRGSLKVR